MSINKFTTRIKYRRKNYKKKCTSEIDIYKNKRDRVLIRVSKWPSNRSLQEPVAA
jgi:hypothetical protein